MGDEIEGRGSGAKLAVAPSPDEAAAKRLADPIARLQSDREADIILYNGPIDRASSYDLLDYTKKNKVRKNVFLLLATYGGDPDAAYRTARGLKARYEQVTICVAGICKSAGTLVCLGADELVIAEGGELGPLDIQLRKQDEVLEYGSGLDMITALDHLAESSLKAFKQYMVDLIGGAGLTTKSAADIASETTVGLFGEVYRQIDPVRLGEVVRANNVATHYGFRLSNNLQAGALDRLVHDYPAHSFCIDLEEAKTLFKNVRPPTNVEEEVITTVEAQCSMRGPRLADTFIARITPEADDGK